MHNHAEAYSERCQISKMEMLGRVLHAPLKNMNFDPKIINIKMELLKLTVLVLLMKFLPCSPISTLNNWSLGDIFNVPFIINTNW